jgi:serine/threonine-protein kinase
VSRPRDPTLISSEPDTQADADEAYCAACNQSFAIDHEFCPNDGAKLVKLKARADMLIGRVFDARYEIRAALGHGGMGTVYRGWQRSVDREVAIKVIHPKLAAERSVAKRFLREARLSSRLSQPNIVNVYDFGQSDDGILYLVMELLRGRTLSKELEAQQPLPLRRIKTIAAQICDALEAAHGQGIIHRDLKPGNVLILDEPPGRDLLKILDFGLAKSLIAEATSLVTQTDALLGTPLYMPPEQILGKPSDQRADLYSLGCMLYQMATGRPPFIGENINITLAAHVQNPAPPLPLSVPPSLSSTIVSLMMKNPDDRIATARLVHDALAGAAEPPGRVPELRTDSRPSAAPMLVESTRDSHAPVSSVSFDRPARQTRWWLPLLALLAIAAIVVVIVNTQQRGGTAPRGSASGGMADAVSATADAFELAIDAGVVDARVAPTDAARTPGDARVSAPVRRVDAGVRRPITPDARVPVASPDARVPVATDAGVVRPPADARMPDLDLLPTKRGSGSRP